MQRVIKTKEPWPPCSPKWDLLLSKPWCTGERAWAERGVGTSSNTDDQRVKKTWKKVIVNQSCPTLYNSMDCSLPGSSVHEISQARILEWFAISFSRGSSLPRDWTHVSCIGRQILYHWAIKEAPCVNYHVLKYLGIVHLCVVKPQTT